MALDVPVEGVDLDVPVGQHLGPLPVPRQQGVRGPGHVLADHGEELEDLGVDLFDVIAHGATVPAVWRQWCGRRRAGRQWARQVDREATGATGEPRSVRAAPPLPSSVGR